MPSLLLKTSIRIGVTALCVCLSATSAATAQQTLDETLNHDEVDRTYILYVPASYDGLSPVPLVFNFHGYQFTASHHMSYGDMRAEADEAGFILVYPQGSLLAGSTHWNVGSWTAGSTSDDIGFTAAMIDAISATYNIDLDRVYSVGYSNGGYFSFELACQLSDRIAAVASVAGSMSFETFAGCKPARPLSVLQMHGTTDLVVRYTGNTPFGTKRIQDVLNYWATHNGINTTATITSLPDLNTADGSTVERHTYDNSTTGTTVAHYKVLGGGHDWPALNGAPSQVNVDISASRTVWDFVSQYDLNGRITEPTHIAEQVVLPNRLDVFPNPTTGHVTLETHLLHTQSFKIISLLGRVVMQGTLSTGRTTLDLSHLAQGIYLLQVGNHTVKVVRR